MPLDFFTSDAMRSDIGAVNHTRGREFAESVAEALRMDGWLARTAVDMTELGGSPELGDIDVLGWKPHATVQLIESKRLQLARTLAEIAEVCPRFRGEAIEVEQDNCAFMRPMLSDMTSSEQLRLQQA